MPVFRQRMQPAEEAKWVPLFTRFLSDVSAASTLEAAIAKGAKLNWDADAKDQRTISKIMLPEKPAEKGWIWFQTGGEEWYAAKAVVNDAGQKVVKVYVQEVAGAEKKEEKPTEKKEEKPVEKKEEKPTEKKEEKPADKKEEEGDSGFGAGSKKTAEKKEDARNGAAAEKSAEEKKAAETKGGQPSEKKKASWEEFFSIPEEKLGEPERGVDPALYVVAGEHEFNGKKTGSYKILWVDGTRKTISYSKKQGNGVVFKIDGSEEFYFAGIPTAGGLQVWKHVKEEKAPGKPSGALLQNHPLHGKITYENVFGKDSAPGEMFLKALAPYFKRERADATVAAAISRQITAAAHDARPGNGWVEKELSVDAEMAHAYFKERSEQGGVYFLMRASAHRGIALDFYHGDKSSSAYNSRMVREGAAEFFAGIFCGYTQAYPKQAREMAMLLGSGAFTLSGLLSAYFLGEKNSCYSTLLEFEKYRPQDKSAVERFIREKGHDLESANKFCAALSQNGFFPNPI